MSDFTSTIHKQLGAIALARSTTSAPLPPRKSAEELLGIQFKPGDRVMDSTSGQQGTIAAGTIRHTIVPAAPPADGSATPAFFQLPNRRDDVVITVQLDDGSTVERTPSDLIALPASLTLPIAHLEPVK